MPRGPQPAKSKEAKSPVARKSPKNDSARVRDLEKRLASVLEREADAQARETATAEILRVIASSPNDVQLVFDTIAENAQRLLHGWGALVVRFDGELLHMAGLRAGPGASEEPIRKRFPQPVSQDTFSGVVVRDRAVKQIADVETDDDWISLREHARRQGWRANLGVPMLHDGQPIGVITVTRREPGAFSAHEVDLLKTFADQAVIAIENVRLFNETKESLERQTATSEILRVISSSPTDVQPVFEAITDSAMRLFRAWAAAVFRYEGQLISMAAARGGLPGSAEAVMAHLQIPHAPTEERPEGRTALTRTIQHVVDADDDMSWGRRYREDARARGFRSYVAVPMLRGDVVVGVITVSRQQVGGFAPDEISLLQTFADQAVIAIENVRLFKELETRNHDLTTALNQQTATSEILKVISSSPTDAQPVFEAIVRSVQRLSGAYSSSLTRLVDGEQQLTASSSTTPSGDAALRAMYPLRLTQTPLLAQALAKREPLLVEDAEADPRITLLAREIARQRGIRSWLQLPLIHRDSVIGVITVGHAQPRAFTRDDIELLRTFADQAVIAIENVRLFRELQEKNKALTNAHVQVTEALDRQTATADILRVISSSPTDVQPVFDAIVRSASRLLGGAGIALTHVREGLLHRVAEHYEDGRPADAVTRYRQTYPRPLDHPSPPAVAVRTGQMFSSPDTQNDPRVAPAIRENAAAVGYRKLVIMPMLRDGKGIGAIHASRAEAGSFSEAEIALLKTFADQAVIAIENDRLFKELEMANRELAAASQHKSEFLANMSHELRTPLNAIIGFSEVLTDRMFGELNEKQEEYLKDIYASGTHLLSLINDILDLSKIEAGRMELELTEFDLPTAIENALMLVRERAGRRSIALHTNIDNHLGQIQADERKVRQVVLNLLSNAIKFTPEGGRIDVGAMPKDGFVEVSVSDTGIGIAPEDQEKVFEEFRQVGTAAKKIEGTGLGLTLCRKFVELHGGRIRVKSQLGEGSTFTFTIPGRHGE